METSNDGDFKNTLPNETDDRPDSGMPRQLRTQNGDAEPLSRAEAEVAGLIEPVYGDDDESPNADDQRDAHQST